MNVFKFYTTNKYYGGEYSVVLSPRCPFYQFFFIFVFPLQSFHVYYRESTITGNINLAILQDVQYLKEIDVICCHFTLKMVLSYNCFYYKIFQEYFFIRLHSLNIVSSISGLNVATAFNLFFCTKLTKPLNEAFF